MEMAYKTHTHGDAHIKSTNWNYTQTIKKSNMKFSIDKAWTSIIVVTRRRLVNIGTGIIIPCASLHTKGKK